MIESSLKDVESRMQKAILSFQDELKRVRTGRATPALLESIKVDYYGTATPIQQMASISTPEPRLLIVQPWDQSSLPAIEKALMTSDIGLVPQNDGKSIKLPIPPLTEDRRKEFVKMTNKMAEDSRVAIRNIRRHGMEDLKTAEKEKTASEDELKKAQERIQKLTDQYTKKVDEIAEKKSKEILEI